MADNSNHSSSSSIPGSSGSRSRESNGSNKNSSMSGSTFTITPYNGVGSRSAFSPYKPTTILTNLQRGNVQQQSAPCTERTIHEIAAQGELFIDMIQHGQNVDVQDIDGYTPLMWAAYYGQLATVKLLLEHGASSTHEGHNGETALLFAAAGGHLHVLKELIRSGSGAGSPGGVNINHTDHDGCTALMYATAADHPLCVRELLKHSASLTATDNWSGATAYSLAVAHASQPVIDMLNKHLLTLMLAGIPGGTSALEAAAAAVAAGAAGPLGPTAGPPPPYGAAAGLDTKPGSGGSGFNS